MDMVIILLVVSVILFLAVLLVRTLLFRPQKGVEPTANPVTFDRKKAVESLQALVRCKTVSYYHREEEDEAEFQKLLALLPNLYPNVFAQCTLLKSDERSLLLKWEGAFHNAPSVMMAHYDVVPAQEDGWEKPPFGAVLEDGVLWGRGTLDTKVTLNAALSAADRLIAEGFLPQQDVYFAFSGEEEINGLGAAYIVDYFEQHQITPALVLDEGGAVVTDVFPGVREPAAMIGIAEKGMLDLQYRTYSSGGHASAPKPRTCIGSLAKACIRVEKTPFPAHLTLPVRYMFDTLGRHSTFLYRLIFANLWCFSGLLDLICKKSGGEINALMRTTVAFTRMWGSRTNNVIPPEAGMISNIRLNPMDSTERALKRLERIIGDPSVEITKISGSEPSRISAVDQAYEKVAAAATSTWAGCIPTPYLMFQCSDSRHYGRISDHVYRFSAMDLTAEERAGIHGNNERIRVETIEKSVEFYLRLLKSC